MKTKSIFLSTLCFFLLMGGTGIAANTALQYPVKIENHKGKDLTPSQALDLASKNPHVFILDVRSRPEYVLLGHPTIAHHVPYKFWTGKHSSKGYGMVTNPHFAEDLKARFNPKTDTLIFMCRSGKRSCLAANAAAASHWPEDKLYNMMGGFEGDKLKNKDSAYYGQRILGGWKNEGLPWTYKIDPKLAYPEVK